MSRRGKGPPKLHARLIFEELEPRMMLSAQPIISEFLAKNSAGLTDSNGNRWDWIEIYNNGDESIELGAHGSTPAWSLECGGTSWSFPSGYTLSAHEFKVVFAAGSAPSPTPSGVWATFKLSTEGEDLRLLDPYGTAYCDYSPYPQQTADISYGLGQTLDGTDIITSDTAYYFATPTPGAMNSQNYWMQVADTKFSADRGFYSSAFQLSITTATAGATIRYTLNGSDPSDNGRVKSVAMITRSGATATAYCPSHGFAVGNSVLISGAEQSGYNGVFTVLSVPTADAFTYTVSSSLTTPATGVFHAVLYKLRTVSGITLSGATATASTSAAHGYSVGDWVRIAGADQWEYNGVVKILSVPSATTFTYAVSGSPISPATGSITSDLDNTKSVSSIARSGTTATATTSAAHGYAAGDWVQIAGADQAEYNGVFQISTAPTSSTFTYTLAGTPTTPATGTITVQGTCLTYTGPLTISKTSTVRAAAYMKGYAPTNIDTQTYIFLADVVTQSATGAAPPGWPAATTINGQIMDYGMDPDIVNSPTWGPNLQAALLAIPTISIVTAVPNLLNASSGIYVNATQEGEQWERPASVELINPDGTKGFQIDGGLRIRGGTHGGSGTNDKHAFRLFFKSQYGYSKLNYTLFGSDGVDSFDKLDLRCSSNMSWASEGSANDAIIRDWFARQTQLAMGEPSTHSKFYHLYIDGQYWGLYQSEERPEAAFAASYFGGSKEDYDVIKVSSSHTIEATDGNLNAWQALWNMAKSGFASNTTYYRAQGLDPVTLLRDTNYPVYLDVDNLIDYMIGILYTGDRDAPISAMLQNNQINNWYGIWNHDGNSGFKFIRHDAEITLSQGDVNRNGPYACGYSSFSYSNPQYLHEELMANAEYRMRFADRVQKFLTHNGVLTASSAIARFRAEAEEIGYSILNGGPVVAESARWGDAKKTIPLTKNDWLNAVNNEINNYFPTRASVLIAQLKVTVLPSWRGGTSAPLYPSVTAPDFNQYGGAITPGFQLTMTGQGTIYYMLDGTDPRLPGGAIRSGALIYAGAVTLNSNTHLLARSYYNGSWSALSDVTFTTAAPKDCLRITEIMYHPSSPPPGGNYDKEEFEYIELQNIGASDINLAGVRFTQGVTFTFPDISLAPGAYTLVVENEAAFASRYPGVTNVAGQYSGKLNNAGEVLTLIDANSDTILSFEYVDDWYPSTDGQGYSLVIVNPAAETATWGLQSSWRVSTNRYGSPGEADPLPGVIVSPTSGLTTTESGGTAQFTVALSAQPLAEVTISIASSNTGEGTVNKSSLTFTADNWNQTQTVIVTGVMDSIADGDISYAITLGQAVSADSRYNGLDPWDVWVTNVDKTRVWDGGGSDNYWLTPENWVFDIAPAAGDRLVFPSGAAVPAAYNNSGAGTVYNAIVFTGSGYCLWGDAVALTAGIIDQSQETGANEICLSAFALTAPLTIMHQYNTGDLIVRSDFILGDSNLTIDGAGDTRIEGEISGAGGIIKSGSGSLSLTGNNSYTGPTVVLAGELHATPIGAVGRPTTSVVVEANAALDADAIITGTLTVGSGGVVTINPIAGGPPAALADQISPIAATVAAGIQTSTEDSEAPAAAPVADEVDGQAETQAAASDDPTETAAAVTIDPTETAAAATIVCDIVSETATAPASDLCGACASAVASESVALRGIVFARESFVPKPSICFELISPAIRGPAGTCPERQISDDRQADSARTAILASPGDDLPYNGGKRERQLTNAATIDRHRYSAVLQELSQNLIRNDAALEAPFENGPSAREGKRAARLAEAIEAIFAEA